MIELDEPSGFSAGDAAGEALTALRAVVESVFATVAGVTVGAAASDTVVTLVGEDEVPT